MDTEGVQKMLTPLISDPIVFHEQKIRLLLSMGAVGLFPIVFWVALIG